MMARTLRDFQRPAATAEGLADKVKELKAEGNGVFGGDLGEEGVRELLLRSGRRGGRAGEAEPKMSDGKGTARFWVQDGHLVKFEYTVSGTVSYGERQRTMNRTATVEIKDVGTAKVDVPEDAAKMLQ